MPMVNWATAGTATVELTILEKPEGNLKKSSNIQIPGCFIKNDENLQHFVKKFIDDSADRNKFYPGNSKYIFYSPVSDFKGDVTKAVLSYEKISRSLYVPQQKTKTCTVEKPLVITFDGHFFLCCDSKDLNKSKFLEEYSKEVRINQTLDHRKDFYGIGMEDHYFLFIHFSLKEGQLQNDIYGIKGRTVFDRLEEAGPLILKDNKTIVGCYIKSNGNCSIKINMFGKSQGHQAPDSLQPGSPEGHQAPTLPPAGTPEGHQAPTLPPAGSPEGHQAPTLPPAGPPEGLQAPTLPPAGPPEGHQAPHSPPPGFSGQSRQSDQTVTFLYDQLRLESIGYLDDYIRNGRGTLDELKERFLSQLTENEREEIDTVRKLVKTLEDREVIGANNVKLLKMLAEKLELRELKEKVEKFEAECSTGIHIRTMLTVLGTGLTALGATLMYMYGTNPERLENLQPFLDVGAQLFTLLSGSVVFVLKVSSVSSLKRLWQSYKDGSLKEKLKKAFNEMEELKEVSQGEEIDVEVTIDEEEYREALRHLSCERDGDFPKDKQMDVKVRTKTTKFHTDIVIAIKLPLWRFRKSSSSLGFVWCMQLMVTLLA